jgi:hypothetical protein
MHVYCHFGGVTNGQIATKRGFSLAAVVILITITSLQGGFFFKSGFVTRSTYGRTKPRAACRYSTISYARMVTCLPLDGVCDGAICPGVLGPPFYLQSSGGGS